MSAVEGQRDPNLPSALHDEIRFTGNGITIGGQELPGVLSDVAIVKPDGAMWLVEVTFLTDVMPVSSSDVVNELHHDDGSYLVRPALPGDD